MGNGSSVSKKKGSDDQGGSPHSPRFVPLPLPSTLLKPSRSPARTKMERFFLFFGNPDFKKIIINENEFRIWICERQGTRWLAFQLRRFIELAYDHDPNSASSPSESNLRLLLEGFIQPCKDDGPPCDLSVLPIVDSESRGSSDFDSSEELFRARQYSPRFDYRPRRDTEHKLHKAKSEPAFFKSLSKSGTGSAIKQVTFAKPQEACEPEKQGRHLLSPVASPETSHIADTSAPASVFKLNTPNSAHQTSNSPQSQQQRSSSPSLAPSSRNVGPPKSRDSPSTPPPPSSFSSRMSHTHQKSKSLQDSPVSSIDAHTQDNATSLRSSDYVLMKKTGHKKTTSNSNVRLHLCSSDEDEDDPLTEAKELPSRDTNKGFGFFSAIIDHTNPLHKLERKLSKDKSDKHRKSDKQKRKLEKKASKDKKEKIEKIPKEKSDKQSKEKSDKQSKEKSDKQSKEKSDKQLKEKTEKLSKEKNEKQSKEKSERSRKLEKKASKEKGERTKKLEKKNSRDKADPLPVLKKLEKKLSRGNLEKAGKGKFELIRHNSTGALKKLMGINSNDRPPRSLDRFGKDWASENGPVHEEQCSSTSSHCGSVSRTKNLSFASEELESWCSSTKVSPRLTPDSPCTTPDSLTPRRESNSLVQSQEATALVPCLSQKKPEDPLSVNGLEKPDPEAQRLFESKESASVNEEKGTEAPVLAPSVTDSATITDFERDLSERECQQQTESTDTQYPECNNTNYKQANHSHQNQTSANHNHQNDQTPVNRNHQNNQTSVNHNNQNNQTSVNRNHQNNQTSVNHNNQNQNQGQKDQKKINLRPSKNMEQPSNHSSSSKAPALSLRRPSDSNRAPGFSHPNIQHFLGCYPTKFDSYTIVFEPGIFLGEVLAQEKQICEKETIIILRQVLEAIYYCHTLPVQTNLFQLKADYILLTQRHPPVAKLSAVNLFGTLIDQPMSGSVPSPSHIPPELLENSQQDRFSDIWGVGIIAYQLLSGLSPFEKHLGFHRNSMDLEDPPLSPREVFDNIRCGAYDFPSPFFDFVSDRAKAFISRTLQVDPKKRPTAAECLVDPFLKKPQPEILIPLLLCRTFQPESVLHKDRFPLDLFKTIVDMSDLGLLEKV